MRRQLCLGERSPRAGRPRALGGRAARSASTWPSGRTEEWTDVPVDRYTTLGRRDRPPKSEVGSLKSEGSMNRTRGFCPRGSARACERSSVPRLWHRKIPLRRRNHRPAVLKTMLRRLAISLGRRQPRTPAVLADRSDWQPRLRSARARVWVAHLTFSRCREICPDVIDALKGIQSELKGQNVRFVSFTVDPEHDRPQCFGTTPRQRRRSGPVEVSDWSAQSGVAAHPARASSACRPTS